MNGIGTRLGKINCKKALPFPNCFRVIEKGHLYRETHGGVRGKLIRRVVACKFSAGSCYLQHQYQYFELHPLFGSTAGSEAHKTLIEHISGFWSACTWLNAGAGRVSYALSMMLFDSTCPPNSCAPPSCCTSGYSAENYGQTWLKHVQTIWKSLVTPTTVNCSSFPPLRSHDLILLPLFSYFSYVCI